MSEFVPPDRRVVLAIEPECYRRWVDEARAHAGDPSLMAKLHAPDAAAHLVPTVRLAATASKSVGDIAVVRVSGFITQKPSMLTVLFGGTSVEQVGQMVAAAMAEPSIGAVVLDVDSPGGVVFGVPEAASVIRASRGSKPFIAVSNPLMASAAYYLASQADEVVAIPSSLTGSIGVMAVYVDESKLIEKMGLTVEEITYGRRKAEESGTHPLTDEARGAIQARVDYYGHLFEADVAKGRMVSVSTVRAKYGEGSVLTAKDAMAAGLADRVATLDEVIAGLARGQRPAARMQADFDPVELECDPVEMAGRAALHGIYFTPEQLAPAPPVTLKPVVAKAPPKVTRRMKVLRANGPDGPITGLEVEEVEG